MPHAVAKFNGQIIAETDSYQFVEGNVYVSPLLPSTTESRVLTVPVPAGFRKESRPQSCVLDDWMPVERDCLILQYHG